MSTVSRRGALLGALGGALALTGCGAEEPGRRTGTLRSRHWPGRDVRWEVALPDRDREGSPIVLVLHGKGGRASSAFDDLHLDDHVAATGLTIAAVDGGDGYWHARRSGIDSGAMVVDDFLPLVRRLGGYRGKVAFLGWSMGGYGSLLLAAGLGQDVVGAVVAESAALWTGAVTRAPTGASTAAPSSSGSPGSCRRSTPPDAGRASRASPCLSRRPPDRRWA